ncbi:hypothetical protein EVAR_96036_1 [Eumeta japonica]|uniref:Uncharacterized protein n=1 Tax=Eumeta variegata TaxID=151549 RepID=A0A4C1W7N1_EUMVA|nr:hypothetical protein EVAR_96036_1 [Eumeta japonica]
MAARPSGGAAREHIIVQAGGDKKVPSTSLPAIHARVFVIKEFENVLLRSEVSEHIVQYTPHQTADVLSNKVHHEVRLATLGQPYAKKKTVANETKIIPRFLERDEMRFLRVLNLFHGELNYTIYGSFPPETKFSSGNIPPKRDPHKAIAFIVFLLCFTPKKYYGRRMRARGGPDDRPPAVAVVAEYVESVYGFGGDAASSCQLLKCSKVVGEDCGSHSFLVRHLESS